MSSWVVASRISASSLAWAGRRRDLVVLLVLVVKVGDGPGLRVVVNNHRSIDKNVRGLSQYCCRTPSKMLIVAILDGEWQEYWDKLRNIANSVCNARLSGIGRTAPGFSGRKMKIAYLPSGLLARYGPIAIGMPLGNGQVSWMKAMQTAGMGPHVERPVLVAAVWAEGHLVVIGQQFHFPLAAVGVGCG